MYTLIRRSHVISIQQQGQVKVLWAPAPTPSIRAIRARNSQRQILQLNRTRQSWSNVSLQTKPSFEAFFNRTFSTSTFQRSSNRRRRSFLQSSTFEEICKASHIFQRNQFVLHSEASIFLFSMMGSIECGLDTPQAKSMTLTKLSRSSRCQ